MARTARLSDNGTSAALAVVVIFGVAWLAYKVLSLLVKGFIALGGQLNEIRLRRNARNAVKQSIKDNNNKLAYSVRSYKNTKSDLIQYVDFVRYDRNEDKYTNINNSVVDLLAVNKLEIKKYSGKSNSLLGSVILKNIDPLHIEDTLSKILDDKVELERV